MAQQIENDKNETTLRLWNPMNTSAPYGSDNTPPLDIESPKETNCRVPPISSLILFEILSWTQAATSASSVGLDMGFFVVYFSEKI